MTKATVAVGDSVFFEPRADQFGCAANFGIVKSSRQVHSVLHHEVVLPTGRILTCDSLVVHPLPILPTVTVGDTVTVAGFIDTTPNPEHRVPTPFWQDINPTTVMTARFTNGTFHYLLDNVPLEYTRWIPEQCLFPGEFANAAEVFRLLRDSVDPSTLASLKAKLADRALVKTL